MIDDPWRRLIAQRLRDERSLLSRALDEIQRWTSPNTARVGFEEPTDSRYCPVPGGGAPMIDARFRSSRAAHLRRRLMLCGCDDGEGARQ